jgi:hypothetical protein
MGQLCYEADGDRRYYERAVMLDLRSASIKSNGVSSCSVFFKFRLAHGIRPRIATGQWLAAFVLQTLTFALAKLFLCMEISRTMAKIDRQERSADPGCES